MTDKAIDINKDESKKVVANLLSHSFTLEDEDCDSCKI